MPPPVNDNFADAIALVGDTGQITVDNSEATSEVGEPGIAFGNDKTVWFTFVPSADGLLTLDTFETTDVYWTMLAVYVGASLAGLDQLSIANRRARSASPGTGYAGLSLYVFAGRTYRIQLDNGDSGPVGGEIVLNWELKADTAPAPWTTPVASVPHDSFDPHPDAHVAETFEGYADTDELEIDWADKDPDKATRGWANTTETGHYVPTLDGTGGFYKSDFAGEPFNGHQTLRLWSGGTDALYHFQAPALKTWQRLFIRHDSTAPYDWTWVKAYNRHIEDAGGFGSAFVFYLNGFFYPSFNLIGAPVAYPFASTEERFVELITCYDIIQEGVNAGHQLRLRLWVDGALLGTWLSDPLEEDWTQVEEVTFQTAGSSPTNYPTGEPLPGSSFAYVGLFEFVTGCNPYSDLGDFDDECCVTTSWSRLVPR